MRISGGSADGCSSDLCTKSEIRTAVSGLYSQAEKLEQIENMMTNPFPEVKNELAARARHRVFARADRKDRRQKPTREIGAPLWNHRGRFTTPRRGPCSRRAA